MRSMPYLMKLKGAVYHAQWAIPKGPSPDNKSARKYSVPVALARASSNCLALIVAARRHREPKADDQCENGQGCSQRDVEIATLALFKGHRALAREVSPIGCNGLRHERNCKDHDWTIETSVHLDGPHLQILRSNRRDGGVCEACLEAQHNPLDE